MPEQPNAIVHLVNLGGTTYPLRFTFGGFAMAAGELGVRLTPLGQAPFYTQADQWYQLCVMLYAGLRGRVPGLTLEWVAERVTPDNIQSLDKAVAAAFADFFRQWLTEDERAAAEAILNALPSLQRVETPPSGGVSGQSPESDSA